MERPVAFVMHHFKGLVAGTLLATAAYIYFELPPSRIVIATGPKGGFFETSGEAYKAYLAKRGVEVELRGREDTLSIIDAVEDPKSGIDVGFAAQSIDKSKYPRVKSLGGITYEPFFLFYRKDLGRLDRLDQLKGRRVAVGLPGVGTRKMADQLLPEFGVTEANTTLLGLALGESVAKLKSGAVDAIFVTLPAHNAIITDLATTPGIEMMSHGNVEALAKQFPAFHAIKISKGSYSLKNDIPDRDLFMPAVTAQVLVREDLSQGIIYELLAAMEDTHSSATITNEENEFPSTRDTQIPVDNVAREFYRDGLPFFFKHLPFYLASLLQNTWIYILPLVILAPLVNLAGRLTVVVHEIKRAKWLRHLREMHRLKSEGRQFTPGDYARLAKIRRALLGGGDTTTACLRLLQEIDGADTQQATPTTGQPPASARASVGMMANLGPENGSGARA
jgi:TRAP transporter TAXI family solute receptor